MKPRQFFAKNAVESLDLPCQPFLGFPSQPLLIVGGCCCRSLNLVIERENLPLDWGWGHGIRIPISTGSRHLFVEVLYPFLDGLDGFRKGLVGGSLL